MLSLVPWSVLLLIPSYARVIQGSSSSTYSNQFHCRLFIWDGISALKYHICKKLIQDNIYEGRGGVKFVRIRPGSLLDHLYPLSQHKRDGCMLCGHSFHDHLTRWWYTMLHTPFDLYLDRIRDNAEAITHFSIHGMTKQKVCYRYHDAYVVSQNRNDRRMNTSSSTEEIEQRNHERNQTIKHKDNIFKDHRYQPKWEIRQVGEEVIYQVPRINFKPSYSFWERSFLTTARAIALEELDMLIFLEGQDH